MSTDGVMRRLLVALVVMAGAPAHAACVGDCNADGMVVVNELVAGVAVALGMAPLASCEAIDEDGDGQASIAELVAAVRNALGTCPPPEATATASVMPSATPTATGQPTATATVNAPPRLRTDAIYRAVAGFPIAVPVAEDPEGGAVECTVGALPAGAAFDPASALLSWTPGDDQLGAFAVDVTCADTAVPPASAAGALVFEVAARDTCAQPSCDPALGCTMVLPPPAPLCCAGGPPPRRVEPDAGCPAGRVLLLGQSSQAGGVARLQNCDPLLVNAGATRPDVQLDLAVRCVNAGAPVHLRIRLESSADDHPLLLDQQTRPFALTEEDDGFAHHRGLRLPLAGAGPFFDLEGAEANLSVTLVDQDGLEVSEAVRVRLTFGAPMAAQVAAGEGWGR